MGEVADAIGVGSEAEFHFGGDLVALGDRDLPHVVAEAAEFRALPVVPMRAPRASRRRCGPEPPDRTNGRPRLCAASRMRVWMKPASRSPCADWFRFMKSMSIVSQGRSRPNWVWRCTNGFCSAFSPRTHIFEGENVCIQRMRPAQSGSEFASRQSLAISSGVVSSALNWVLSGSFGELRERACDLPRVSRDLLKRTGTVEMLRAANEPDFRGGETNHSRLIFMRAAHI